MIKYFLPFLALLVSVLSVNKTHAFGVDVMECVHHDVPSHRFEVLGALYNEFETCAMYHYLLNDDIHGDNPQHGKSLASVVKRLTNAYKIHDPEICLIKMKIQGVDE